MNAAGISASSSARGRLPPEAPLEAEEGVGPVLAALPGDDLAVEQELARHARASAAATSGNCAVTSSSVREKSATRDADLCACARMPSNLSSTAKAASSAATSSASSIGDASMKPIGWKRRKRISARRPSRAAAAVSPMSPQSRRARATASRSRAEGRAIASSTRRDVRADAQPAGERLEQVLRLDRGGAPEHLLERAPASPRPCAAPARRRNAASTSRDLERRAGRRRRAGGAPTASPRSPIAAGARADRLEVPARDGRGRARDGRPADRRDRLLPLGERAIRRAAARPPASSSASSARERLRRGARSCASFPRDAAATASSVSASIAVGRHASSSSGARSAASASASASIPRAARIRAKSRGVAVSVTTRARRTVAPRARSRSGKSAWSDIGSSTSASNSARAASRIAQPER